MGLHVFEVYTGQRKGLDRNAPEHPALIEPKCSKQNTNWSMWKNANSECENCSYNYISMPGEAHCAKHEQSLCVLSQQSSSARQGFSQSLTDSLTQTKIPQGCTNPRSNFRRFVTAWQIYLQTSSALTFPPSALYSFSSPSRSLAKPKSVIFTWFGDFTRTLRAARSRCTSLLSSRYIMPWRNRNSTIMLISLTWFWRANFHWWLVKWLVQLWVFTMRKWTRGQKFNIALALNRARIRWPWVSPVWMIL